MLYRTLAFALWALAGAVYSLLRSRTSISRDTLRVPFCQQCYLFSPFALALSVGTSLLMNDGNARALGACVALCGFLWL